LAHHVQTRLRLSSVATLIFSIDCCLCLLVNFATVLDGKWDDRRRLVYASELCFDQINIVLAIPILVQYKIQMYSCQMHM
jgi:hypothetical protein